MSAYICEPKTIDTIVSTLVHGRSRYDAFVTYGSRPFKALGYDLTEELDAKRLAFDLHRLNCLAVDARYQEFNETSYTPSIKHRNVIPTIAAYKACACLRYQCSEGNVPSMPLYKALCELKAFFAEEIVESLPAYYEANCGENSTTSPGPIPGG